MKQGMAASMHAHAWDIRNKGSEAERPLIKAYHVDLVEWHKNCILQFLREHQPNAVEAAPDLEVVQNPLAKSQGVPDQQAMDDHLNLSDKQNVQ
jgi:hypothetical protein